MKLQELTVTTTISAKDLFYCVRDPSGTPVDRCMRTEDLNKQLDHDLLQNVGTMTHDELETSLTAIEGSISSIEGDITTIQGDITTIEGNLTTAQGNITTLQSGLDAINQPFTISADGLVPHPTTSVNKFLRDDGTWATGPTGADGKDGKDGADGATGATGPAGADGTDGISFTWKDAWGSSTDYVPNDVVFFNGSAYISVLSSKNKSPATETTYWDLMVQKGDTGATGATGAAGADGSDGAAGADGADGADGVGVPVGGTTGQVLKKASNTDYDTKWDTDSVGVTNPMSKGLDTDGYSIFTSDQTGSSSSNGLAITTGTVVDGISGSITIASGTESGTGSRGTVTVNSVVFDYNAGDYQILLAGNLTLRSFSGDLKLGLSGNTVYLAGFVIPTSDGTSGQALVTDGAGNLSFATVGGGGGLTNPLTVDLDVDGNSITAINNIDFQGQYQVNSNGDVNSKVGLHFGDLSNSKDVYFYPHYHSDGSDAASGDVLTHDGSGNWYAAAPSGGGGGVHNPLSDNLDADTNNIINLGAIAFGAGSSIEEEYIKDTDGIISISYLGRGLIANDGMTSTVNWQGCELRDTSNTTILNWASGVLDINGKDIINAYNITTFSTDLYLNSQNNNLHCNAGGAIYFNAGQLSPANLDISATGNISLTANSGSADLSLSGVVTINGLVWPTPTGSDDEKVLTYDLGTDSLLWKVPSNPAITADLDFSGYAGTNCIGIGTSSCNIDFSIMDGMKLDSSSIGFFGVTPVSQPSTISDPSGVTTDEDVEARTAIAAIIDLLQSLGLMA